MYEAFCNSNPIPKDKSLSDYGYKEGVNGEEVD